MFIALVAPSFSGKTQSAFSLKEVRPLYFVTDLIEDGEQLIYRNFQSLSQHLIDAAKCDYGVIEKRYLEERNRKEAFKPSPTSDKDKGEGKLPTLFNAIRAFSLLSTSYNAMEFQTLGFLMKLIQDSDGYSDEGSWMRFHSDRNDFKYSGKTPVEFKAFLKNKNHKYCFFLDEFVGESYNVLLRNLARGVGLRCIVANTNSDIGNLIGHAQSLKSRVEWSACQIWSVIFNFLNSADWDKSFGYIDEKIQRIINSSEVNDKEAFRDFFNVFKTVYAPIMLPGIVVLAAGFIDSYELKKNIYFLDFLNEFIDFLGSQISRRKIRLVGTIQGIAANYGLFLNYAYDDRDEAAAQNVKAHRKSYLLNHLYFLLNPVDSSKSSFLVFKPSNPLNPLQIYKDGEFSSWATEST